MLPISFRVEEVEKRVYWLLGEAQMKVNSYIAGRLTRPK